MWNKLCATESENAGEMDVVIYQGNLGRLHARRTKNRGLDGTLTHMALDGRSNWQLLADATF